MKRTELLKALRDAVNIFERLEKFVAASNSLKGIDILRTAKLYLQLQHDEMRFVAKWTYWESYQKYRK